MSPADALQMAQTAGRGLGFLVSDHAEQRMGLDDVAMRDIGSALATAQKAVFDEAVGTWRFSGGRDIDGVELAVVLAFRFQGPLVVTVFRP